MFTLIPYQIPAREFYTFDPASRIVATHPVEKRGETSIMSDGFGQYLRLQNPEKGVKFISLLNFDGSLFLLFGSELYPITEHSKVDLILPWIGKARCLTLVQNEMVILEVKYVYTGRDIWEDGDGDICWDIRDRLKTTESRNAFLAGRAVLISL